MTSKEIAERMEKYAKTIDMDVKFEPVDVTGTDIDDELFARCTDSVDVGAPEEYDLIFEYSLINNKSLVSRAYFDFEPAAKNVDQVIRYFNLLNDKSECYEYAYSKERLQICVQIYAEFSGEEGFTEDELTEEVLDLFLMGPMSMALRHFQFADYIDTDFSADEAFELMLQKFGDKFDTYYEDADDDEDDDEPVNSSASQDFFSSLFGGGASSMGDFLSGIFKQFSGDDMGRILSDGSVVSSCEEVTSDSDSTKKFTGKSNMDFSDVVYEFEHKFLPDYFYESAQNVVRNTVMYNKAFILDIINSICREYYIKNEISYDDLNVIVSNAESAVESDEELGYIRIVMPEPKNPLECKEIVLMYTDDLKKGVYFTLEKMQAGKFALCSWEPDGTHSNYGVAKEDMNENLKKMVEIFETK